MEAPGPWGKHGLLGETRTPGGRGVGGKGGPKNDPPGYWNGTQTNNPLPLCLTQIPQKSTKNIFRGGIVPYKSDKQRKYFNANKKKLERQGVDVDEWNRKSKGKKLPKRRKKREKRGEGK